MLKIKQYFPTNIGDVDCDFMNDIQKNYTNIINKLKFDEKGLNYFAVHKDKRFKKLNDWIKSNVDIYVKAHKYQGNFTAKESWVINYKKNNYQPWHLHPGWTISTIFYLKADENDVVTMFKNPHVDMLNPLNRTPETEDNEDCFNDLTYSTTTYKPKTGRLLIFRSFLEHMVPVKTNNKTRIIFSYNFNN